MTSGNCKEDGGDWCEFLFLGGVGIPEFWCFWACRLKHFGVMILQICAGVFFFGGGGGAGLFGGCATQCVDFDRGIFPGRMIDTS